MSFTHIIVPAAGLQAFESGAQAFALLDVVSFLREVPAERMELHEDSLSLPWEIAYARALGLPSDEGRIAWAAYETQTLGQACAWVHPCRLEVGMTDMVMQPTDGLRLTDAESRELHALVAPYFEQDGITLRYHSAARWLALGEPFAEFECASLARVQGRSINDFLPDPGEFPLQLKMSRLQAEVQMLLYTHPLTEVRQSRGLPAVNSFWVDGAGVLDTLPQREAAVQLDMRLADAAHSAQAYAAAWQALQQQLLQQAEQALAAGADWRVSLCGEKAAVMLCAKKPDWKDRFLGLLGHKPSSNMREML